MPGLVVGENVPGILSSDSGRSFRTIVGSLVELGYRVSWRILDLRYFRVPQRRRRVFIVGSLGTGRSAEILFESDCLRGDSKTGSEAGQDSPKELARCLRASCGDSDPDIDTYIAGTLKGGTGARGFSLDEATYIAGTGAGTSRPAGNANETDLIIPMAFKWQSGGDSRGLDPTEDVSALSCHQTPAVAFTTSEQANSFAWERDHYPCLNAQVPNDSSNIQHGVRQGYSVRRLTPRECERLMGLPDDFTRYGADGKEIADGPRYKMLGNGWSVPQAEYIARRAA